MRIRVILLGVLSLMLTACAGAAVDASKAYSRGVINRGAIVPAESVRLHEYLSYYDQSLPEPVEGPLAMELRLGNAELPRDGGTVWLQVGLQARSVEPEERTPLNLALVLDVSGSMRDRDKMPYLKESLRIFLHSLRPEDRVAIVVYEDRAYLIQPSTPVGDGWWIEEAVARLQPGGRTNLHAGLMKGFQEVDEHYDRRRSNKVLLLTDGKANRGVTNPERIAAEALRYNDRGIQLSTVGLGMDLNDRLLSTLAHQGRGAYHFIDSAQEMDRVFREEVTGLVERVAGDIAVALKMAPGVELAEVVGAEWDPAPYGARIQLPDMGAGDSQVLLAQLQVRPGFKEPRELAEVILDYQDPYAQRTRRETEEVRAMVSELGQANPLADPQVRRNVTIIKSANALIEIDKLFQRGEYEQAWYRAHEMEGRLRSLARRLEDPQLAEDADLFARYQVTLEAALGYDPAPTPNLAEFEEDSPEEGPRLILPTVEVR